MDAEPGESGNAPAFFDFDVEEPSSPMNPANFDFEHDDQQNLDMSILTIADKKEIAATTNQPKDTSLRDTETRLDQATLMIPKALLNPSAMMQKSPNRLKEARSR